jgi:hypothetical protein
LKKNCSFECINSSLCPSVPYFFAIFQPTTAIIFKFLILGEDYLLSTRSTAGFFDPKVRGSGIEVRLGPYQIMIFSLCHSLSDLKKLDEGSRLGAAQIKWNKEETPSSNGVVWAYFLCCWASKSSCIYLFFVEPQLTGCRVYTDYEFSNSLTFPWVLQVFSRISSKNFNIKDVLCNPYIQKRVLKTFRFHTWTYWERPLIFINI